MSGVLCTWVHGASLISCGPVSIIPTDANNVVDIQDSLVTNI